MLIGIVVKNGIVLIDYIILCRERGLTVMNSVVTAGKSRLRPVLMTTATTVLGMIPMAIGGGQGSEMWSPMAIAVIGGLSVSTILTLILIPTLYCVFAGTGIKNQRRKLRRQRELDLYFRENKRNMKSVLITFDQAYFERIIALLDRLNCRGFSYLEKVQGRGSKTGDPHFGSHAWPSMCSAILTVVDDNKVDPLLDTLHKMDLETEQLGLRAFVWNIERTI